MKILIIAGGSGKRLWPISRLKRPKQLQKIISQKSLLQDTVDRARHFVDIKNIYLVVSDNFQVAAIQEQIPDLPQANILREPEARNTAAAIAYGLASLEKQTDGDDVVAVLSADHVIANPEVLQLALKSGETFLENNPDYLIAIGIKPTYPETGYGYIELGHEISSGVFEASSFKEKPTLETAKSYLSNNKYLWNAGIFLWPIKAMIASIIKHSPAHAKIIEAVRQNKNIDDVYSQVPNTSIDYAVIEKEKNLAVMPLKLSWIDIGHWRAVKDYLQKDIQSNVVEGHHIAIDTKNCLIVGRSNRVIATVGIDDLIIVDTDDALLICRGDRAQDVKQISEMLEEADYNSAR